MTQTLRVARLDFLTIRQYLGIRQLGFFPFARLCPVLHEWNQQLFHRNSYDVWALLYRISLCHWGENQD